MRNSKLGKALSILLCLISVLSIAALPVNASAEESEKVKTDETGFFFGDSSRSETDGTDIIHTLSLFVETDDENADYNSVFDNIKLTFSDPSLVAETEIDINGTKFQKHRLGFNNYINGFAGSLKIKQKKSGKLTVTAATPNGFTDSYVLNFQPFVNNLPYNIRDVYVSSVICNDNTYLANKQIIYGKQTIGFTANYEVHLGEDKRPENPFDYTFNGSKIVSNVKANGSFITFTPTDEGIVTVTAVAPNGLTASYRFNFINFAHEEQNHNDTPTIDTPKGRTLKVGDVDDDGNISSADALLVLRYSVKLENFTDSQIESVDVNKDGDINSADALFILRKSVKLTDNGTHFD